MPDHPHKPEPETPAEAVARAFFGVTSNPGSIRRAIRRWLAAAAAALVLVPFLFYLRFGQVPDLGWGLTVFLVAFCLLAAIGLYYLRRPQYHTPVALRGDWGDRVGAFWLVSCAFGPFFGWLLTSALPLTVDSWRWLYAGRAVLSVALPVLTALPLLRYVRGRGAVIMLALLLGVTALPVWSAWSTCQDLFGGPVARSIRSSQGAQAVQVLYLPNTGQALAKP